MHQSVPTSIATPTMSVANPVLRLTSKKATSFLGTLRCMARLTMLVSESGGGGWNWNGPRDWSTSEYGPGASSIDTSKPFQVEVGFPADGDCQLKAMEITLSQDARSDCTLKLAIDSYSGMTEMTEALTAGMTPIVSYWKSADMLWMDGKGADGQGPCETDSPDDCGKRAKFSNFSVGTIPGSACMSRLAHQQPAEPVVPKTVSTTAATTTPNWRIPSHTTPVTSEDVAVKRSSGSGIPPKAVGPLGFIAGALSVSFTFIVIGYIRSRQSQQIPERPEMRTLQHSFASSNVLVSQASVAEQRESEHP